MFNENPELIITSLDKQIWDEELENFVPKNIFDVHTHIYKWSFNQDPKKDIGERDIEIEFMSVKFKPGNYIYADLDGVIISETELEIN